MSVRQDEWEKINSFLKKTDLSIPEIAKRVGRSATTIYYLISNGGPRIKEVEEHNVSKKLSKFIDYIDSRIRSGVINSNKLFTELLEQGYKGSYALVNQYVKKFRIKAATKKYKRSIRFETQPGEQAQVDWGSCGKIQINGKIEKLYCFVYVLGYSRAMYLEFTTKQNLQNFEYCHINAFEALGIPQKIVYDNVKTVVLGREKLSPEQTKIQFNLNFLDFSQYYNFEIVPCHPYWPRAKGKVESGVKYVKNNFMQGIKFKNNLSSLEDLNRQAKEWVNNIANKRIHGTIKTRPVDQWKKEKPFLTFVEDYPSYHTSPYTERYSTKDGFIQYKSNFYSIPFNYSRRKLFIREVVKDGLTLLNIYFEDKLAATHRLSNEKGKIVSIDEHFVPNLSKEKKKISKKSRVFLEQFHRNFTRPLSYYNQLNRGATK